MTPKKLFALYESDPAEVDLDRWDDLSEKDRGNLGQILSWMLSDFVLTAADPRFVSEVFSQAIDDALEVAEDAEGDE